MTALDPQQHAVVEGRRGEEPAAEARMGPGDCPDGPLVPGELGELGDGLSGDVKDLDFFLRWWRLRLRGRGREGIRKKKGIETTDMRLFPFLSLLLLLLLTLTSLSDEQVARRLP